MLDYFAPKVHIVFQCYYCRLPINVFDKCFIYSDTLVVESLYTTIFHLLCKAYCGCQYNGRLMVKDTIMIVNCRARGSY